MRLSLRARTAVVVAAMTAFAVLLPAAPAAATTRTEVRFAGYLNAVRVAVGLPKLRLNELLSNHARAHSYRMARTDTLYHNPALATELSGWRTLGENVGYGPTSTDVHRAFVRSAPHWRNYVGRAYRQMGVGIVRDGALAWVTVIFYG